MNAMTLYRIAHRLRLWRVSFAPRVIDKLTVMLCGVLSQVVARSGEELNWDMAGLPWSSTSGLSSGRMVMIRPCVTLGGRSGIVGVPVIGDDVFIGTGAKVLGNVHVGDRAVIGANAVVLQSVPDDAVVGGVPAKIVRIQVHASS